MSNFNTGFPHMQGRISKGAPFDDDRWELYHLDEDFSESRDLADEHLTLLQELVELWWREAGEHGVLPLDDRTIDRHRPPAVHSPLGASPHVPPADLAPARRDGPGDRWSLVDDDGHGRPPRGRRRRALRHGHGELQVSFFVQHDRLHFDYNAFGDHTIVSSDGPVPVGPSQLAVRFERNGQQGRAELRIDGVPSGRVDIPFAMRIMSSVGADVGLDRLSPVSERYAGRYPFEGVLRRLDADVDRSASGLGREAQAQAEHRTRSGTQ